MTALEGYLGHFDMLYDDERNLRYEDAIHRALLALAGRNGNRELTALDVGCGSGLLGLLCWKTGAFRSVTFVEAVPELACAARQNIRRQHVGNNKTATVVLDGHSTEVLHQNGEAVPACGFDLVVSELLDSVLIGEGVLPSMRKLIQSEGLLHRLPGHAPLVIPAAGRVMGALFTSEAIFKSHRPFTDPRKGGAIVAPIGFKPPSACLRCSGLHAAEQLHLPPYLTRGLMKFQSAVFQVFDFDFATSDLLSRHGRIVDLEVELYLNGSHLVHGVALWFETDLLGDGALLLNTTPITSVGYGCGGPPKRDHWRQAVFCFSDPLVAYGAPQTNSSALKRFVRLRASHDDDAVWFGRPQMHVEESNDLPEDIDGGTGDHAPDGRPTKRARVLERRGSLSPQVRCPDTNPPPLCRCGLCASTSHRRLAMTANDWASFDMPWSLPSKKDSLALLFGDGHIVPLKIAQASDVAATIVVSRGHLLGKVLSDFLVENKLQKATTVPPFVYHADPRHGSVQRLPLERGWALAETSELADDHWDALALQLLGIRENDVEIESIKAFAEPWYDDLAECWDYEHYLAAAADFSELGTLLRAKNCDLHPVGVLSDGPELWGAPFVAEHLWRTRQPLQRGTNGDICGLDLCALDELHPSKLNLNCTRLDGPYSVDLWPYFAEASLGLATEKPAFQLCGDPAKLLKLPGVGQMEEAQVMTADIVMPLHKAFPSCLRVHGVVLWLRAACDSEEASATNNRWLQAENALLSRGDEIRYYRYGVVLFKKPLEASDATVEIQVTLNAMEVEIYYQKTDKDV